MSFIQQFFTSRDNNANAATFVGQEGRLWWDPITNQIYSSDGNTPGGIPLSGGGGGNGSPGGANSQVQFNQNGNFGGSANLTFNRVSGALTAVSFVGDGSALSNITGANVSGTVSDATHAGIADTAYSVDAANVFGTVANASYATISGTAYSVSAANVSGTVANATYAITAGTAYSVSAANVSGTVANAAYATSAGTATTANSATTAGTVTANAQPNITSVGTLTSITSTGNVTGNYFIGNGSQLTGVVSSYGDANVAAYLPSYHGNLSPNYVDLSGNLSVDGSALIGGNLNVTGNINFSGNVNQISGNSGQFFGNAAGVGALYAGIAVGYSNVVTAVIQATSDLNDYTQINAQNLNHGNTASMDYIVTADNGTDTTAYIDMGIAGSGWDGTQTNSLGNAVYSTDGYLYVQGGTGGGNLVIGTTTLGKAIKFNAGGPNSQNTVATIGATGFSTTGNVTGAYILGNGSQLTGVVSSYGNSNVAANLAAFGSNPISTTGNITAGRFIGNGSLLTSINASNVSGNVANATYATTAGSTTQLVNGSSTVALYSDGTMSFPSGLINTGSNTMGLWSTNSTSLTWRTPTATTAGQPFQSILQLSNAGISITALSGNVSNLTTKNWGFAYNGNLLFPDSTVQTTAFTGIAATVTTNAQPNITSVGTLTSVSSTGNVTGGNLLTGGMVYVTSSASGAGEIKFLGATELSNIVAVGAIANTLTGNGSINLVTGSALGGNIGFYVAQSERGRFTSSGLSVTGNASVSGNVTGGNLIGTVVGNVTGTTVSVTGNITGGNLNAVGLSLSGNVVSAINTTANITTTGNVSGGNLIGTLVGNVTGTTASLSGNITGGNLVTSGLATVTGNVQGGNIRTVGQISATGTITSAGSTNGTAFAVGNSAVSNVALGMFPTAGTPGEYAIRDYSTVNCNFYIDAAIGGTGTPTFVFRGSNSFTTYATISSNGLNMQSLPIQGQTPYLGKTSFNVALDTVVSVDNLKYRISNQGGVFPQIASVSGSSVDICWSIIGMVSGVGVTGSQNSGTLITTFGSLYTTHGMDTRGDTLVATVTDKSAGKIYRVTFAVTNNASNTTGYNIIVERIM